MNNISMVSTFGPNVRGVSPYADSLSMALEKTHSIALKRVDYSRAFPGFLLPRGTSYEADNEFASINYLNPFSWNVCKQNNENILHIQYWSPAFLPLTVGILHYARRCGTRTLLTCHNPKPHESVPLLAKIESYMLSLCDGVICHTDKGKEIVRQARPGSNVTVCHHGCHITGIKNSSIEDYRLCGLSTAYRYILFFGNIRPYKGVDVLLDAWQQLKMRFPDTRLVIAGRLWGDRRSLPSRIVSKAMGTSSNARTIEQKLSDSGSDVMTDLTFISNEKLQAYLRIASLAVFPYRSFESQSGAASLAAGAGVPLVTTDVGGLTDLAIDERFIVKNQSSSALADVLAERLDDNVSYRTEQLEIARRFSWDAAAKKHLQVYRNL